MVIGANLRSLTYFPSLRTQRRPGLGCNLWILSQRLKWSGMEQGIVDRDHQSNCCHTIVKTLHHRIRYAPEAQGIH